MRKNFRGFDQHLGCLVKELLPEFPELKERLTRRLYYVDRKGVIKKEEWISYSIESYEFSNRRSDTQACVIKSEKDHLNGDMLYIAFNRTKETLSFSDDLLRNFLRHEILHFHLNKGDGDIEFIEEMIERGLIDFLNAESRRVLYMHRTAENSSGFNKELFDACFYPADFEYWSGFLKKTSLSGEL
jgi:hypothetical protein